MTVCFAMVEDFHSGVGVLDESGKPRYSISDLEHGIGYARSGLEAGRRMQSTPPVWGFESFIGWAEKKIRELQACKEPRR
jgi:hypothetical protein